mgnify:FL=1
MKKMIIGMVVGMIIMSCAGFIGFIGITKNHEAELAKTKEEYETQISELEDKQYQLNEKYTDTEENYSELQEQVWNMKNGKPYEVKIDHDNKRHIYESNNKLFSTESETIIEVTDVQYK